MYASIRRYQVNLGAEAEIIQRVNEGFVPIISKSPGFIAYYLVDAGDGVIATVSIFQDQVGAEESNAMAAEWVIDNLISLVPDPPLITAGEVKIHKTA